MAGRHSPSGEPTRCGGTPPPYGLRARTGPKLHATRPVSARPAARATRPCRVYLKKRFFRAGCLTAEKEFLTQPSFLCGAGVVPTDGVAIPRMKFASSGEWWSSGVVESGSGEEVKW